MQPSSPVGSITKGGQPAWSFDIQGSSVFWMKQAEELNRMVELGFCAWMEDIEEFKGDLHRAKTSPASDTPTSFTFNPSTTSVAIFLAALALENLLKGNLIVQHPEYISNGRFRGEFIGSHDLLRIAGDAGITLNQDEQDLCELCTEAISSFGRYPIGKNVSDSPTQITVKQGAFRIYERLFKRLAAQIKSKPWK